MAACSERVGFQQKTGGKSLGSVGLQDAWKLTSKGASTKSCVEKQFQEPTRVPTRFFLLSFGFLVSCWESKSAELGFDFYNMFKHVLT